MSPDLTRALLATIVRDIRTVEGFVAGLDRETFANDERTVFAVCYGCVRIGEGVSKLPEEFRAMHPGVPWQQARAFRNFIVHVYLAVDPRRLFDTVTVDLAALRVQLEQLQRA